MVTDEQREEIEQVYRAMYDALFYYASLYASDAISPDEVVQEVFAIACEKSIEFLASNNRKGWLMVAVKNVIYNAKTRNVRKQNAIFRLAAKMSNQVDEDISLRLLYSPFGDTEDFKLIWEQANGVPIKELAKARGISENACKKRLQRAKEALRNKLLDF